MCENAANDIHRAEENFATLLQILEGSEEIVVIENAEEWEDDEKLPTITPGEIFRIPGSIVSFVERLDDELTRSLQHIDPHTAEYVERLSDEGALYTTLVRTLVYVEALKKNPKLDLSQDALNRVVMRRLEHVYFKVCYEEIRKSMFTADLSSLPKSSPSSSQTHGKPFLQLLTLKSHPAPSPTTLRLLSRHSARTSSRTARVSFEHELCSARSTSWRYMITTIGLAT